MVSWLISRISDHFSDDLVVLDVCAGIGDVMKNLPSKTVVAVDIYKPYLQRFQERKSDIVPVVMNATELCDHFLPNSFDIVTCFDGVEHLEQDEAEKLISDMELLAKKKVIIFTPEGFTENVVEDTWNIPGGDKFQTHKCGFTADYFKERGYEVDVKENKGKVGMVCVKNKIETFWNKMHSSDNGLFLSRSNPELVFNIHGMAVPKGKKVLDLGVGFGTVTKFLKENGNQVAGVDISPIALERVKDYVDESWLVKDLNKCSEVDLAISHLVFQHCDDEMVLHILKNVPLKKGGMFSFQFAELIDCKGFKEDKRLVNYFDNNVFHFRSVERMRQLINKSGLKLISMSGPMKNTYLNWYIMVVKKER